jgi:YidC/Oxa1 family membrane protein insertase
LKEYGLTDIMSFGFRFGIRQIGEYLMLPLLNMIHGFIPNYGIALIIFSIFIKLLLYPLSIKQMQSVQKMQVLAPEINKVREKYADDNTKQQQEIMKLYSEYGANPAGGCLPMLLQMPILFALWQLLRSQIDLRQTDFIWWITDLSVPDKLFYIGLPFMPIVSGLALAMGVTMFVQQKITVTDPRQKSMVYMMPIMFTIMFSHLPAGLNLYYFMFNLLSIAQQTWMNKYSKKRVTLEDLKKAPKKEGWFAKKMREAQELQEMQKSGQLQRQTGMPTPKGGQKTKYLRKKKK